MFLKHKWLNTNYIDNDWKSDIEWILMIFSGNFTGYLANCERFSRISTGVTRYDRRWPFTHNFQSFNRMSQSVQNTTSSSAVAEESEKLSIVQRFKTTYKKHGKILVGVHIVTSLVWYGSFYLTLSRWVWHNYHYSVENMYSIRYDLAWPDSLCMWWSFMYEFKLCFACLIRGLCRL